MGAPTGFSATKNGSNIELSWTNTALSVSSSGGCTAASRIGNYVEKQENGSSTWILMANAGSSATSWSGPPGDGDWKFRVRSVERYYQTDDIFTCKEFTSYFSSTESGYFLFGTDTTPDPFDFGTHTTNALLNSYYYSPNTITVAGMSTALPPPFPFPEPMPNIQKMAEPTHPRQARSRTAILFASGYCRPATVESRSLPLSVSEACLIHGASPPRPILLQLSRFRPPGQSPSTKSGAHLARKSRPLLLSMNIIRMLPIMMEISRKIIPCRSPVKFPQRISTAGRVNGGLPRSAQFLRQ